MWGVREDSNPILASVRFQLAGLLCFQSIQVISETTRVTYRSFSPDFPSRGETSHSIGSEYWNRTNLGNSPRVMSPLSSPEL